MQDPKSAEAHDGTGEGAVSGKAGLVTCKFEAPVSKVVGLSGRDPEQCARACRKLWKAYGWDWEREHVVLLSLDSRGGVRGEKLISIGSSSSAGVPLALFLRAGLLLGGESVVVVHNHPSGDPRPSDDDLVLFRRLRVAGLVIGLPLDDALIMTRSGKWYSWAVALAAGGTREVAAMKGQS